MNNERSRQVYSACYSDASYRMGSARKIRMLTAVETCIRNGIAYGGEPYRLLDVGCGRGELLKLMAESGDTRFGWLHGLEIVPELTGQFPGYSVSLIPSIAACEVDGVYDIVLCSDVLEHVDPSETLRSLRKLVSMCRGALILHVAWFSHVWAMPDGEQVELHINRMTLSRWVEALRSAVPTGRTITIASQEFPGEVGIITAKVV